MQKIRTYIKKFAIVAAGVLFTSGIVLPTLFNTSVYAAQMQSRSLTISSSANGNISTDAAGNSVAAGQGGNGAAAKYRFGFIAPGAASTLQSIEFQFCTSPIPGVTCTLPTGMSVASAVLGTSGDAPTGMTGWALGTSGDAPTDSASIDGGTGGRIRVTRTNGTNVSSDTASTITFTTIKNPTSDNYAFYVRILTYTSTSYTTQRDYGTVASSTAQQVDITAKVQEKINFSVGTTITAPTAACTAYSDSGALALGDTNGILDTATAYAAVSYFRLNTNSVNGAIVQYSGETLKSGSNSITAINGGTETSGGTSSTPGTAQFGLGIDTTDASYSFTQLAAVANPAYGSGGGTITAGGTAKFNFNPASKTTPITLASSSGGVTCDTASVRYLGNISTSVPAGIYQTTITYIAVPTF